MITFGLEYSKRFRIIRCNNQILIILSQMEAIRNGRMMQDINEGPIVQDIIEERERLGKRFNAIMSPAEMAEWCLNIERELEILRNKVHSFESASTSKKCHNNMTDN